MIEIHSPAPSISLLHSAPIEMENGNSRTVKDLSAFSSPRQQHWRTNAAMSGHLYVLQQTKNLQGPHLQQNRFYIKMIMWIKCKNSLLFQWRWMCEWETALCHKVMDWEYPYNYAQLIKFFPSFLSYWENRNIHMYYKTLLPLLTWSSNLFCRNFTGTHLRERH